MWINGQIINLDYLFMTAVMAMRETTVAQKAHTTHQSLRTTIPMSVVKQLKIKEGDKIDWEFASDNGQIYVKFKKSKLEDNRTNGDCCFNHIIGLPTKEAIEKPMFDYEKILYDSLLNPESFNTLNHRFKNKHLWVKKATGLGVTEFFLRLMAWLCLKDNSYRNPQMCIVTGPNIDIAIKLIKRMKGLFGPN